MHYLVAVRNALFRQTTFSPAQLGLCQQQQEGKTAFEKQRALPLPAAIAARVQKRPTFDKKRRNNEHTQRLRQDVAKNKRLGRQLILSPALVLDDCENRTQVGGSSSRYRPGVDQRNSSPRSRPGEDLVNLCHVFDPAFIIGSVYNGLDQETFATASTR
ncbi:hypothetical protein ACLKA7_007812 [Drosophila subpalustris]